MTCEKERRGEPADGSSYDGDPERLGGLPAG